MTFLEAIKILLSISEGEFLDNYSAYTEERRKEISLAIKEVKKVIKLLYSKE